jgi:hypothetical protein
MTKSCPREIIKHGTAHQYLLKERLGWHFPYVLHGKNSSEMTTSEKDDYSRWPIFDRF